MSIVQKPVNCKVNAVIVGLFSHHQTAGKEGNLVGRKLDKEKLLAAVLFNWMFVFLLV